MPITTPTLRLAAAAAGAFFVLVPLAARATAQSAQSSAGSPSLAEPLLQQPGGFVPNLGQWDHPGRYLAQLGATTVFLEDDGFLLTFAGPRPDASPRERVAGRGRARPAASHESALAAAVRLQFVAANAPTIEALAPGSTRQNWFLGRDPSRWRTDVPSYGGVRYHELWRGVDVRCYVLDGHFEYDLELTAGADLAQVAIDVHGAERLAITADGALVVTTAVGEVRQPAPVTFEVGADGVRRPIRAHYRLCGPTRFGFEAPEWNGGRPLVVDPGILYATTLGSVFVGGMAMDGNGVVTVCGDALGLAYPTTTGAYSPAAIGGTDWFVTQIDPSLPTAQQLRYTTYFGGSGNDSATEVAVDAAGVVTVVGSSDSTNYPTTLGALQSTFQGGSIDVTVTQLDPSLVGVQQLRYATLLGGNADDLAYDLGLGWSGDLVVAGFTDSATFPTSPGCWDPTVSGGGGSAFVVRIDPAQTGAAQLLYGTYLGGSGADDARTVAIDLLGRITVAGYAESLNFPTTIGAFQTVHGSPIQSDAYVAQFDPSLPAGQQLVYSTYFGGNADDWFDALTIDPLGDVVTLVGTTGSANLATTPNAFRGTSINPASQFFGTFVVRLVPSLGANQLVYATYLISSGFDFAADIATTGAATITVTGGTDGVDFPTTSGALDRSNPAGNKAYVSRLDIDRPPTSQLVYSTYLGGGAFDYATGMALDANDSYRATIVGYAASPSFPTTPGAFGTPLGGGDLFLARLDLRPAGVEAYGAPTPGCTGSLELGALDWPQVGSPAFALTCRNTLPNSLVVAAISTQGLGSSSPVLGIDLWIDPLAAVVVGMLANGNGVADLPFPLPSSPTYVGFQMYAQFASLEPTTPPPCPVEGLSASGALHLTLQP